MSSSIKKVSVIGLGYVGLPVYVALVKTKKYDVTGYTISQKEVNLINSGISPIRDEEVTQFLKNNKVIVTSDKTKLQNSDVFIVCVPTPIKNNSLPDYNPVLSATKSVAPYMRKGCHFVLESTVNPGTCEELILPLLEKETDLKAGIDFNIAHCPERINPGDAKWNIYNINRNIGSISPNWNKEIAAFYRTFIINAIINEVSCLKVAEASKIVENAFRDINIAYVNELAQSFDALGIDLIETLQSAANKPFAFMVHWPGCGVGGHCIPVDPYYLIRRAGKSGFNHKFLKLARQINNDMPNYTVKKLESALKRLNLNLKSTKVALLGLSYKPNLGDLRESPSLEIKERLLAKHTNLITYDPFITCDAVNLQSAIADVTAIIIATSHKEFIDQLPHLLPKTKVKVIVDGRNCLQKKEVEQLGINYLGIGR